MALSEIQQVTDLINRSQHILITFSPHRGGDAVGSALALATYLEKINKRVDIVSTGFNLPGYLRFLPGSKRINSQITALRKFIISLDLKQVELQDLSYNVSPEKLDIYLTPKNGSFQSDKLSTKYSPFIYDLIVVLDTPDLMALGDIYQQNTEFFFNTTIVNVDHSPANEHFGQINLVDLNVPATADLVFELIEAINPNIIEEDIATCLFTGLTTATRSFKTIQVTPQTLARAGHLVNLGARREEVVQHLYRTKQLSTLKLWGRVLARLKSDSARKLVWSLLQTDDFIKAGAGEDDLTGVVEELITNAPEAGTVVLLYELTLGQISIYLHAGPGRQAINLLKPFNATGDRATAQTVLSGLTLMEAEKKIIEHLKLVLKPLE